MKIGGLSTVQTPRLFFRTRSRAGHVARPDSARFVAAFDVSTRVDVNCDHSAPTRTSLTAVSDTPTQLKAKHVHR